MKARKEYKCHICEKPIKIGADYERYEHFTQTKRGLRRLIGKRHTNCPKIKEI